MPTRLDITALTRLTERLRKIENPNAQLLMDHWVLLIDRDNKAGVLAGLDKDGIPLAAVTYRPVGTPQRRLTAAQRNTLNKRSRRGKYIGLGVSAAGLNNNLTTAEYQKLAGPPLAPRGAFSRVITNLLPRSGRLAPYRWEAVGFWDEVVSVKGVPFLGYHFRGEGRQKHRDLTGVRPEGFQKARASARAWMISEVRNSG